MTALRIATAFLIFGIGWILLSDRLLETLVADPGMRATAQSIKGIVFVWLSTTLVYWLVRAAERRHAALDEEITQERDRLTQVLNVNPAVIYSLHAMVDGSGRFEVDCVSPNVLKLTGYTAEHWLTNPNLWIENLHPQDLAMAKAKQAELAACGEISYEYRFRHADGSYRWIHDQLVLEHTGAGRPAHIMGTWLDVSDSKQADEHSRVIAQVFDTSQEGIFITDADTRFISVNQSFTRITGYSADDVMQQTPRILSSGRQDKAFYQAMWATIEADGRWEGEIWNRRKTGEIYPEWLVISAIKGANAEVLQYLGIFTETSGRKEAEARILRLVNYDSLTNLPNRALLFDRARVAIASALRNQTTAAVLHLNIDHFKHINESFGHDAGDDVLKAVAQRLVTRLKPEDTVTRLGADDFVLLLPHTTAVEAGKVALRLMAGLNAPLPWGEHNLNLTASVGIATYPDNGTDLLKLMQAAETAIDLAKREGRNNVRFFTPALHEQMQATLAIERDLQHAAARGQLVLHYQPQVDARTRRIVGIEALVRWQHPEWGLVPPARFIPVAEQTGLIRPIGEWVLNQALADTAAWQAAGLQVVPVAVNLSVVQFRHEGLQTTVAHALQASGVAPGMLELELTESVAMEDSEFTVATINALKVLGVKLSIDDFGTGYSSLSYLKRFAVDKLKIDQSFVRGLNHDAEDEAIVTAVISLANSLGLHTIAEGVETEEQAAFLKASGCNEFQGYL
ncbi:MAG: EAL domain-containing protein, partial [Burkholderiales bacterium]|nr:EAL domain-containing protein [Burkholderiales bacterium]